MRNKYAYQANAIIKTKKEFNLNHLKLFFFLIGGLEPNISSEQNHELAPVVIPVNKLVDIWQESKDSYYGTLKRLLNELSKKSVIDEQGKDFEIINVFRRIKYDSKEHTVTAVFNEDMKPYILDLINKGWTRVPIDVIAKAKSAHTIRHLELMLQHKGFIQENAKTIIVDIDLESYKQHMGISADQYNGRINNFKQKVLNVACDDLSRADMPYKAWYEDIRDTNNRIVKFRLFLELEQEEKEQFISPQKLLSQKMQEWENAAPRSSNANQINEAQHN